MVAGVAGRAEESIYRLCSSYHPAIKALSTDLQWSAAPALDGPTPVHGKAVAVNRMAGNG